MDISGKAFPRVPSGGQNEAMALVNRLGTFNFPFTDTFTMGICEIFLGLRLKRDMFVVPKDKEAFVRTHLYYVLPILRWRSSYKAEGHWKEL